MPQTKAQKLTLEQVEALQGQLEQKGPLSEDDYANLLAIVTTWAHLIGRLQDKRTTLTDLKKILGFTTRKTRQAKPKEKTQEEASNAPTSMASEASQQAAQDPEGKNRPQDKHRHEHGRRGVDDFIEAPKCAHAQTEYAEGCVCPECTRGRLYKYTPARFMSIQGRAPLFAEQQELERLRCNLCDALFTAALSEAKQKDGLRPRRLYSFSASVVVSLYKYFGGMPWHRQEVLQSALGVYVPDASMSDLSEQLADVAVHVQRALRTQAQSASLFYGDDTGALILQSREMLKVRRQSETVVHRTGGHTSCVIAVTEAGHRIAIFETGLQHTGELMDALLEGRDAALGMPLFMGDCQVCNTVTVCSVVYGGCNAHAQRRFIALQARYPEEAGFVRERYRQIFDWDEQWHQEGRSVEERLSLHRAESLPLLREIFGHADRLLEDRWVEPNSDLGEALSFLLNNRVRLSAFTRHLGMPLDNNLLERTLRLSVRLRNNAPFFQSRVGAAIADTLWTVGETALAHDVNLLEYFCALLRHEEDVRAQPDAWLPWNFGDRLGQLEGTGPPTPEPLTVDIRA